MSDEDPFANGYLFMVILGFVFICLMAWSVNRKDAQQDNVDNMLRRQGVSERDVQGMRREYDDYNWGN